MSKVEQALKSAIEALEASTNETIQHDEYFKMVDSAHKACKEALAELEKCEPVARFVSKRLTPEGTQEFFGFLLVDSIPPLSLLYTSPQPREWVGLSEEQENELSDLAYEKGYGDIELIRSTEFKLKQLNTEG